MASSSMYSAPRGFDVFSPQCHAMPIGSTGEIGNARFLRLPLFFVANGISVPISRGRPPGLSVQA